MNNPTSLGVGNIVNHMRRTSHSTVLVAFPATAVLTYGAGYLSGSIPDATLGDFDHSVIGELRAFVCLGKPQPQLDGAAAKAKDAKRDRIKALERFVLALRD
ncbi:hypothetical protein FGG08_005143 [Glutinoglossum americanum]|uniref:Uncharacterized protein n=1 Tax=Glutinoglossum americanum TaxID=1670608 RepID=A0A9P8I3W2_9PEZI|nr:hypothetical protein FGG08_005143 [Glutinoglossum americanum]